MFHFPSQLRGFDYRHQRRIEQGLQSPLRKVSAALPRLYPSSRPILARYSGEVLVIVAEAAVLGMRAPQVQEVRPYGGISVEPASSVVSRSW